MLFVLVGFFFSWYIVIGFVIGVVLFGVVGYIGMNVLV